MRCQGTVRLTCRRSVCAILQPAGWFGDKWHPDEVVISIGGKKHWLWRAVDQDGFVRDVLMQSRHNTKA
jgi:transposase-like protein